MQAEIRWLADTLNIDRLLLGYTKVWDIDEVLAHLEASPSLADLSDMDLFVKTVILTFIKTLSREES